MSPYFYVNLGVLIKIVNWIITLPTKFNKGWNKLLKICVEKP